MDKGYKLLVDFVFETIFKNKNSIVVYIFLTLFYTISLLFSFYILEYKDKFIDKLQSIYPHCYVYTKKDIEPLNKTNTKIYKEIFEINFDQLTYKYQQNDQQILFKNIGLRSFDKQNIPNGLVQYKKDIDGSSDIIYVDQILYKKLTKAKQYKDGIYISYINSDIEKFVKIKPVEIFDTTKWVVLSNDLAKIVFGDDYFDKNVIFGVDMENIYHQYKQKYGNTYRWSDSLSFFGIVFYKLSTTFYTIFNILFLIMIILFIYVTLKGLLKEFLKMTLFASRFGMSLISLGLIYCIGLMLYFDSLILLSYFITYNLIEYINILLDFTNHLKFPLDIVIIINIIVVITTSIFTYYYGILYKREKYV